MNCSHLQHSTQSTSDSMEAETKHSNDTTTMSTRTPDPSRSLQPSPQAMNNASVTEEQIYHQLATYPFATDPEYQAGLASILGHPERPATPSEIASKPDLVLQAQCFYFSRKFQTPPIKSAGYKAWLASQRPTASGNKTVEPSSSAQDPLSSQIQSQPQDPPPQQQQQTPLKTSTPTTEEPPPYPNSFAAIVDLITNNKPIPGIEEIPNTVLELGSSKQDKAARRKKPWETSADAEAEVRTTVKAATNTPFTEQTTITSIPPSEPNTTVESTTSEANPSDRSVEKAKKTGEGVVKILQPNAIPDSGLIAKD